MATNPNMKAIETVIVGSGGAASIEFASIPQTYTDLLLKVSGRGSRTGNDGGDDAYMQFNGYTTGYTNQKLRGYGTNASSSSSSSEIGCYFVIDNVSATASTFGNTELYIPNYTSSNNKSVSSDSVAENNQTNSFLFLVASLWSNTNAITSIIIRPDTQPWLEHTTATLYGITSAGYGAYATGGVITETSTHWIHSFYASGTFTPTQALTADYLVVAGGGGGGRYKAGGGGAGGLRSTVTATGGGGSLESALSLTSGTAYTVTIGAGGAGGTNGAQPAATGLNGNNSVFNTITSTGGGAGSGAYGGGSGAGSAAGNGGSGGGVGGDVNFTYWNTGGTETANQGYAGGTASSSNQAGGGGGAGEAGNTDGQGEGGDGVTTSISGSSTTYAGGGGGGSSTTLRNGGTGGGGNGGYTLNGVAGTANTGGGGGGGAGDATTQDYIGGNGGSGIVIIRYAK